MTPSSPSSTALASPVPVSASASPRPFTIAVGAGDARADVRLSLTRTGPWSRFFGPFDLPDGAALDTLARIAEPWSDAPPRRIDLVGAPAACLLPALWLRTIWLPQGTASIRLRWDVVERSGTDAREPLAAQLCAQIVDEIVCPDRGAAVALWGIEPGPRAPAGAAVFDAMLGLVEAWDINLRGADHQYPVEWLVRARGAIEACADRGLRRIALYGAGTHTRALGPLLMQPRVEIACIIDDNASLHGSKLWGFPIVSLDQAAAMRPDAVVISANSIEDKLWANARPLRDAGIPVIRLYGKEDAPAPAAAGEAKEAASASAKTPITAAAPAQSPYGVRAAVIAPGDDLSPPREGAILGVLAVPPACDAFWGECDRALRSRGGAVYALAYHVDAPMVPLTGLTGSFTNAATLGQTWPGDAPLGPEPDDDLLRRCLAYDRVFWRGTANLEDLTRRGVRAAAWLAEHAAQRLRPRLAVMWHGGTSFCLAAGAALQRAGVPVVYAERAAITPTVLLDRIGWDRSEMTEDPAWLDRMRQPATSDEVRTGRAIARRLLEARAENWARVRASATPAPQRNERTIAFFPTIEAGAEAISDRECAAAGMPLGDSPRACAALLRAAADAGVRVLIKLHPNEPDRQRYQRLAAAYPGTVEITDALGVHDAIERRLPIATTSASVGWLALAAGVPLISLNRRGYSACPAVLQADTPADVDRVVHDAFAPADAHARHEAGLAALARYATGYCYTHDPALIAQGVRPVESAVEWLLARRAPGTGACDPRAWLTEACRAAGIANPA